MERAVKDRVNRLFSSDEASDNQSPQPARPNDEATAKDMTTVTTESISQNSDNESPSNVVPSGEKNGAHGGARLAASPTSGDDNASSNSIPAEEVVGRLCGLLKVQLTKAHQEVVRRYGEVAGGAANLVELVSATGGSDDLDLNELVASQLAILNFIPFETPPIFPPPSVSSSQSRPASIVEALSSTKNDESLLDTSQHSSSITADELSTTKIVPLSPGSFVTSESVPAGHKFKLTVFQPGNMRSFVQSVRKEIRLLQSSLPPGITVKGYEERMDLYSAMIEGPKNTPYEDGLFFFDFQLGKLFLHGCK